MSSSLELEKMLIGHERLCMEDLHLAFQTVDAARALAPITLQILDSRSAIKRYVADRMLTEQEAHLLLQMVNGWVPTFSWEIALAKKLRSLVSGSPTE